MQHSCPTWYSTSLMVRRPLKRPRPPPPLFPRKQRVIASLYDFPPTLAHADWGWADVGFHRQAGFNETVTPNMDALVSSGVLLNQYYVHKCASSTQRPP